MATCCQAANVPNLLTRRRLSNLCPHSSKQPPPTLHPSLVLVTQDLAESREELGRLQSLIERLGAARGGGGGGGLFEISDGPHAGDGGRGGGISAAALAAIQASMQQRMAGRM